MSKIKNSGSRSVAKCKALTGSAVKGLTRGFGVMVGAYDVRGTAVAPRKNWGWMSLLPENIRNLTLKTVHISAS